MDQATSLQIFVFLALFLVDFYITLQIITIDGASAALVHQY